MARTLAKPREVEIRLPRLHQGQLHAKANSKRYNTLCWGRRAGKTTFGGDLVVETTVRDRGAYGWFAPNYKILNPVWDYFTALFAPITVDKSETDHYLKLVTGGIFECWSMDSGIVGRSRKYHRLTVDEAAYTKELRVRWEKELLPTLVDYAGQGYLFSTPNGHDDFEDFYNLSNSDPTWASFRLPTWDNPHLPTDERARVRHLAEVLQEPNARQEYGAEFVDAVDSFIPAGWWEACYTNHMPPLEYDEPIVVAMDAATANDCFAMVGISRRENQFFVRFCRVWTPVNGNIDFAEPEQELRRLLDDESLNIVEVTYDPYQLHDMASRLRNEGLCAFRPFNQGVDRLIADKGLYDLIRDRRITHSGDQVLAQHISNANSKTEGEKLRIVKRTDKLKIDAAVALSMACSEAKRLNIG